MATSHRAELQQIRTFPQLIRFLRDEMGWPIESEEYDDLVFDYEAEELGLDAASAAKIKEIKRLRPLAANQPWGIFFVSFEPKRLAVVALRRILSAFVMRKRASANAAERMAWETDDLLFISNFGEGEERQLSFAHFSQDEHGGLPTLRVLGWDNLDTPLHLDHVADQLTEKLAWPRSESDVERWRETWGSAFTLRHGEVIATSKALAVRLAELARAIRERVKSVLAIETDSGPVTHLMKAFKEALVHDLEADDFADMYAQTVAYGLLSARIANPEAATADGFAGQLPIASPFLKELMETFLHVGGRSGGGAAASPIDFDELGVSEVVELLDSPKTNMEAVVRDFGDKNPQEDPVIHFYEDFLKEYDKKQKVKRGVFYTPRPVVSYIVRSVDELLRSEFGLVDGLADITTWGEMIERHEGLAIPDGVESTAPFVTILDLATGTGTFLVETIDVVHRTLVEKWKREGHGEKEILDLWNDYVPKHLLPRLYGYELLMAPYAIAHLKIGLKLHETGYRFCPDDRLRVYLTNSLEPASDIGQQALSGMLPALAHEAQAVNDVKRRQRFTVVVGNPPYAGHSSNTGAWIKQLVRDYYTVDGKPLGEKNPKWLQDDYVKFIRLGEHCISQAGLGIHSYITNHGYVDNPTFRGMRQHLTDTYASFDVLDLHGNSTKKECCPDGSADENVFEIKQGVAVFAARRLAGASGVPGVVRHAHLYGLRAAKYSTLLESTFGSREFEAVHPASPFYLFVPQDQTLMAEYDEYVPMAQVMPVNVLGFQTHRDHFAIDLDRDELRRRIAAFRDATLTDEAVAERYHLTDNRDWHVKDAREQLLADQNWERSLLLCSYRPFDLRPCFFSTVAMDYPRRELLDHVAGKENICLGLGRQGIAVQDDSWSLVAVSRHPVDANIFRRGGINVFPLWLYSLEGEFATEQRRRPNLAPLFTRRFADRLAVSIGGEHALPTGVTPEEIVHYAYAVFHSPGYRERYAEFLDIDFPRLPLPGGLSLFHELCRLGARLLSLHLMDAPDSDDALAVYLGPTGPDVRSVGWSNGTVWLDSGATRKGQSTAPGTMGFGRVSAEVWAFHIGGYQVCEKWLKDRKGRTLSEDDIAHYQKIVVAIAETIRIMGEIDEVIEEHGGWPGAFVSSSS